MIIFVFYIGDLRVCVGNIDEKQQEQKTATEILYMNFLWVCWFLAEVKVERGRDIKSIDRFG